MQPPLHHPVRDCALRCRAQEMSQYKNKKSKRRKDCVKVSEMTRETLVINYPIKKLKKIILLKQKDL